MIIVDSNDSFSRSSCFIARLTLNNSCSYAPGTAVIYLAGWHLCFLHALFNPDSSEVPSCVKGRVLLITQQPGFCKTRGVVVVIVTDGEWKGKMGAGEEEIHLP